jgi:hypothetical protein
MMLTLSGRAAALTGAIVGALGWIVISYISGRREAWDSEYYFAILLPGLAVLVAWLGFLAPRRAWRWAFVPFAAQALVAFAMNPTGSLMPLGLIVFGVFGIVCLVPAVLAAYFRRWYDRHMESQARP